MFESAGHIVCEADMFLVFEEYSGRSAFTKESCRTLSASLPSHGRRMSNNTMVLLLVLTIIGLALSGFSLARDLGVMSFPRSHPRSITVFGSIVTNSSGTRPTITFVDLADHSQYFSGNVTNQAYSVNVLSGHTYNIQVYYSIPSNNCYTNPQGTTVCLQIPNYCFRGPLTVSTSSYFMRYDVSC